MESDGRPPTLYGDSLSEFAYSFSQTARALFTAGNVSATLTSVVELAVSTIEGCDYAGIFLIEGNRVTTPVHTNPIVVEIDQAQHATGEGPCLDAIAHRLIFYADDLSRDLRWLHFAPRATKAGVRSVLALPLSADAQLGALNLYAHYPVASLALSIAHSHEDEERLAASLHAALASRESIGQALGILMERERITANQAFYILRRASQHLNIKVREVAQSLIDTGEEPDTGPSGADQRLPGPTTVDALSPGRSTPRRKVP
jgi:hypothetical protein